MKKELKGLILAGGKSLRMGKDKGLIQYHGQAQREYAYHLLNQLTNATFLSIRKDQVASLDADVNYIIDEDLYKGPLNGILSAHLQHPDAAWLVLACDMPFVNAESIAKLINERDVIMGATAYASLESKLPEPLFAIWEPEALTEIRAYLDSGNSTCARKFLINVCKTKLIIPEDERVIINANEQRDYLKAIEQIKK